MAKEVTAAPALFDLAPARGVLGRLENPLWPHTRSQWAELASAHSPSYWAAVWADHDETEPMSPEEEEQYSCL